MAEALSALGYQSFVVDYWLRPYIQQEGALDRREQYVSSESMRKNMALTRGILLLWGFLPVES